MKKRRKRRRRRLTRHLQIKSNRYAGVYNLMGAVQQLRFKERCRVDWIMRCVVGFSSSSFPAPNGTLREGKEISIHGVEILNNCSGTECNHGL